MGINSTFKSFVHSEVKTSHGFRLVEAYLTYKELDAEVRKNESAEFALYEDIELLNKDEQTIPAPSDKDFSSDFFYKRNTSMPWLLNTKSDHDIRKIPLEQIPSPYVQDGMLRKRSNYYQYATSFTPKGQQIDLEF